MIGPTNAILKKSPGGKEFNIQVNRLKHPKELPEDYSRGYLRRNDDTINTERETMTSISTDKRRKRQDNRSADLYDDSGPPMEELPKSKSEEPNERESVTETTGSDAVFRDDEDNWSSINDTFSSDEDDDDDDGDGSNPPREISRHSGTYPKTSTPVDSDDEPKGESKKREHVSTSTRKTNISERRIDPNRQTPKQGCQNVDTRARVWRMKDVRLKGTLPTIPPGRLRRRKKNQKSKSHHHRRKHVKDRPNEDEPVHQTTLRKAITPIRSTRRHERNSYNSQVGNIDYREIWDVRWRKMSRSRIGRVQEEIWRRRKSKGYLQDR